jgi:ABC-2 type transport system ATP-binding protein
VDAIVAQELRKRYKTVQALDGVSFSVREGEVFGLLGPNGAGKSTAVRSLATLTRPDSGSATVAGEDVLRHPNRVRSKIGYVAQDSGVDWEATARENLLLQGRIHGMAGKPLKLRVEELLQLVGLSDAADRVARGYSGGMKRRLDIAIGLVHRPSVLFLDEPTTGLDPEARAAMWVEVERLAQQESLTILLTTHYLEEADRLAERVAIVSRGTVVVEGTPTELKANLRGELVTVELGEANGRIEEATQIVKGLADASEVAADGKLVRARVPNGAQAIPAILSALEERGFPVSSVTTARPSLDDVYLHYTGRDFASEDQEGKR